MTLTTNPCSDRLDDMKREMTKHLHSLWDQRVVNAFNTPWLVADEGAHMIIQLDAGLV